MMLAALDMPLHFPAVPVRRPLARSPGPTRMRAVAVLLDRLQPGFEEGWRAAFPDRAEADLDTARDSTAALHRGGEGMTPAVASACEELALCAGESGQALQGALHEYTLHTFTALLAAASAEAIGRSSPLLVPLDESLQSLSLVVDDDPALASTLEDLTVP